MSVFLFNTGRAAIFRKLSDTGNASNITDYTEDLPSLKIQAIKAADKSGITKSINEARRIAEILGAVQGDADGTLKAGANPSVAQNAAFNRYNEMIDLYNGALARYGSEYFTFIYKGFTMSEAQDHAMKELQTKVHSGMAVIDKQYPVNFVNALAQKSGAQSIKNI